MTENGNNNNITNSFNITYTIGSYSKVILADDKN